MNLILHRYLTVIEVLSPVNKNSGEGRETYLKKRQRVLGSLTNLVEIDLLRGWNPMLLLNFDVRRDYRVLVSREERRPLPFLKISIVLPYPIAPPVCQV